MTTEGNAAEGTTAPTTPPPDAGAQGNLPDYKVLLEQSEKEKVNWQSRFTGLQGKYQQEQAKWADDVVKTTDLEAQLGEVSGIREQLDLQVTGLQEQLDTATTEKEISESQLDRLTIVTTEFPKLVPFLQDDLIPDDTGDTLREKLNKMTDRLGEVADASQKKVIDNLSEGATPPPGGGTPPPEAPDLLREATEAMVAGDIDKYNTLYDQYIAKSRGGS
jgi:hypothetical protein